MHMSKVKLIESLAAAGLYLGIIGAAVLMRRPELAMLAALTILPLAVLLGLRRDLSLAQKLARVGLMWYVIPIALFIVWTAIYPGQSIYFLVAALCGLIYFVCLGCLVKLYWIRRE
jgi:hypothetical protein